MQKWKHSIRGYKTVFMETVREWMEDEAARLGAALAFYSVLSIGPLMLIVIAVAGIFFGYDAASQQVLEQIQKMIGSEGAGAIEAALVSSQKASNSMFVTLIGMATLIVGATGFFGQLQDAMNTIWEVRAPKGRPLLHILQRRFLSFAMVLGVGFLLLISLLITAALEAFGGMATGNFPEFFMQWLNSGVSFAVTMGLFAMIFKVLPDVKISWHDVWLGATITAVLFVTGKFAIGLYLGHSAISSSYGAAGSVVVILIWVYYSAQILFFGAEFTQVYARHRGSPLIPARGAISLTEEKRNEQGIPDTH